MEYKVQYLLYIAPKMTNKEKHQLQMIIYYYKVGTQKGGKL